MAFVRGEFHRLLDVGENFKLPEKDLLCNSVNKELKLS